MDREIGSVRMVVPYGLFEGEEGTVVSRRWVELGLEVVVRLDSGKRATFVLPHPEGRETSTIAATRERGS